MHDLACVAHLHSLYSDGTGTVPEIARAGRRAKADVVLLTDHDTLETKRRGEEGWYRGRRRCGGGERGDVLLLVGTEVSPRRRNHYLAFGLDHVIDHRELDAAGICRAVRAAGGFGFAAHPFSRGSDRFPNRAPGMPFEDLECVDGVELWSFVNDTGEAVSSVWEMLRFIVAPGRALDHPPERNLRTWDELCRTRRVVALGGVDAHQFGRRIGPVVLRVMGYRRSFRFIRTHVLCDEELNGDLAHDREQVFGALREGRCYIAVDSVAPAKGFVFEGDDVAMGGEAPAGRHRTLQASVPAPARLRLVRNGVEVASAAGTSLEHEAREPGVYRVEAYRGERTWILSNPIYVRE